MVGLSAVHVLIFGVVAVLLFGNRLPSVAMKEQFKKFLWTSKFWSTLGLVGCVSGLYFQRVAANGSGLWCLGLMFLGAAYLEQQE